MELDNIVEAQFLAMFFGIFMIVRFRQLGKFLDDRADWIPSLFPKKWMVIYAQVLVLVVGLIFFLVSSVKIFDLLS